MARKRALVANADDKEQVADGERRERDTLAQQREDLRSLLALPAGRRFFWRLLGHCKVFETVKGSDDSWTNFNAGMQDVGHFVFGEIAAASPEAIMQMMDANQPEDE